MAKLDQLLREKPNASTLSLEAVVLFTNNKTAAWLNSKTQTEIKELLQRAQSATPDFKQLYQAKQSNMHCKQMREKERLTQDILQ